MLAEWFQVARVKISCSVVAVPWSYRPECTFVMRAYRIVEQWAAWYTHDCSFTRSCLACLLNDCRLHALKYRDRMDLNIHSCVLIASWNSELHGLHVIVPLHVLVQLWACNLLHPNAPALCGYCMAEILLILVMQHLCSLLHCSRWTMKFSKCASCAAYRCYLLSPTGCTSALLPCSMPAVH